MASEWLGYTASFSFLLIQICAKRIKHQVTGGRELLFTSKLQKLNVDDSIGWVLLRDTRYAIMISNAQ